MKRRELTLTLACALCVVGSLLAQQPKYTKDGLRIGPYPCEPGDIVNIGLSDGLFKKIKHSIEHAKTHKDTTVFELECHESQTLVYQIAAAMSTSFTPTKEHIKEQQEASKKASQ